MVVTPQALPTPFASPGPLLPASSPAPACPVRAGGSASPGEFSVTFHGCPSLKYSSTALLEPDFSGGLLHRVPDPSYRLSDVLPPATSGEEQTLLVHCPFFIWEGVVKELPCSPLVGGLSVGAILVTARASGY